MSEQDQVTTEETARPPDNTVVTDETGAGGLAQPAEASQPAGPMPDESAPSEIKPKPSGRSQQRKLSKLSRDLKRSEADNAELKQQVADLAGKVETLANPKPAEPKFEDFDSPQEYAKEYAKWEAPAPAPKATEPPKPAAAAPAPAPTPKPSDDPEMVKFRKAGSDKFGDQFNDAMADETLAVSQVMGDFLLDSEVGPDVYLHLSDNQDLARQIANKSPHAAVKRLEELEKQAKEGKLEGFDGELRDVADVSTTDEPAQPKVATKAPAPPKDQDDRGTMTIKPDPENESMDEYAARRGKEQAAAGYR